MLPQHSRPQTPRTHLLPTNPSRLAPTLLAILLLTLLSATAAAQDNVQRLCDFETPADAKMFSPPGKLVAQGATHGQMAMEANGTIKMLNPPADWSAYDALQLDVFVPGNSPVEAWVAIGDKAWLDKGRTYWNRHNGNAAFAPGQNTWTIPVSGLFRGEAVSRNADIPRNIDPDSIAELLFAFKGPVIIDNLRLVKAQRPAAVWAFDLGPENQAVQLGWTALSTQTRYDPKTGFGFAHPIPKTFARDTTFGPPLLRDYIELANNSFHLDVPPGKYNITVFYENSGYWGGEQARQNLRTIEVNGKQAWKDQRTDGPTHYLYRFENVEPVGVDIWDTYMAPELAKPAVFQADADPKGLTLKFTADAPWGSRVSAIAICKSDDAPSNKWITDQIAGLANEFRHTAICLNPPAAKVQMPAAGFLAWPVDLEETIRPESTPHNPATAPNNNFTINRLAVQGEYEPFCIAIRPGKDLGACRLRIEGATSDVQPAIGVAWYGISRVNCAVAYNVDAHTLRPQSTVNLPKDITREIVVTCHVAENAKAAAVPMTLIIDGPNGQTLLRVPLNLAVHAVKLDHDTDYSMGFFGIDPPFGLRGPQQDAVLDDTLKCLKEHGMNALDAGPNFQFTGFKNGQPQIDFTAMDAFTAAARKYGFTKGLMCYGGGRLTGVNDEYEIGDTGKKFEQDAGLPYDQALQQVFKVVDEHARQNKWPLLYYCICDETHVAETARRQLDFMNAMAAVSKQFPNTLRTDGVYSVNFDTRPANENNLLYWHQQFFQALDASALDEHDATDPTEAAKLGKTLQIYNQGLTRYSFGLYQWSEHRKGVMGRWEWHLTGIGGYQFFGLDSIQEDKQVICYGREGIIPTMKIECCRAGAQDFYLYNTLWNLIQKNAGPAPARAAAKSLLEDQTAKIKIAEHLAPPDFNPDAFKAKIIAAIESLQ